MIRLIQITDTHLMQDRHAELMGMNTRDSLKHVLEYIHTNESYIDAIVASGDLAQDGSKASYEALREQLSIFTQPVYCLPGNHDNVAVMATALNSHDIHCLPSTKIGSWRMLFIDSTVTGQVGGTISDDELNRLRTDLNNPERNNILCFLHHQPVPIGCDWLDEQIVSNHAALLELLQSSSRVHAVAWGHVHQEHDSKLGHLRLLSAPSTCGQFKPNCTDFTMDTTAPGYRWFELHEDGRINTGVIRVTLKPGD